ncbi:MAG: hypothetical protein JXQ23_09325 [Clostridia bacterium]|nr:hypothetical protein [Clostridia bacterium]
MDKVYLEKIDEAEKKADEIMNLATQEAEKLYEKAQKKLKADQDVFEEKLEKQSMQIIHAEIKKAESEARKILEQNLADCEEIKVNTSSKIDEAVMFVINKIGVNKWQ